MANPSDFARQWEPIHESVAVIQAELRESEEFSRTLLDELDRLHEELLTKIGEVETLRRQLNAQQQELQHGRNDNANLTHHIEQQGVLLREALNEIRSLRDHRGEPRHVPCFEHIS